MICFAGRGRILHTDLDPATFEEIVLEVDLCTVSQLKVDPAESCFSMMLPPCPESCKLMIYSSLNHQLHSSFYLLFASTIQVSYTLAGRQGGRVKLVRRLQVAARYQGRKVQR